MGIFDGRGAVVTGGGRGIGRGRCLHLARQGASAVVNDIDLDEARKVVDEISAAGGKASASASNIGTREGAKALIARCVDEFGDIHAPRQSEVDLLLQRRPLSGPEYANDKETDPAL